MKFLIYILNVPPRHQKMLALAITAGLIIFTSFILAFLMLQLWSAAEKISDARTELGEKIAIIQRAEDISKQRSPQMSDKGIYLSGENVPLAQAGLQQKVIAQAQLAGVNASSVSTLPLHAADGISLIGVQIDLSGADTEVLEFIFRLETASPPLIIKQATIHGSEYDDRSTTDSSAHLSAQLSVYGAVDASNKEFGAPAQ